MKSTVFSAAAVLFLGLTAQAQANTTCIPAFVKVGDKYFMSYADKEHHVKVKSIEEGTCWLKVKEVLPAGVDVNTLPNQRRNAYWLNMTNVSMVKKD